MSPSRRHGASAACGGANARWCRSAMSASATGSGAASRHAGSWGFEGGAASPLPDRSVQHCVGWLSRLSGQTRPPPRGNLGRQNRHTLQSGARCQRCQQRAKRRFPSVPAMCRSVTGLCQSTLEALRESPRRTSIAVGRSAFHSEQFIHPARPGPGGGLAVRARTQKAVHGRPGSSFAIADSNTISE